MTEPTDLRKKRERLCPPSLWLFGAVSLSLLLLFLYDSEQCLSLVNEGLLLCFQRIVPALFPFMVLSSAIVSSGILLPLSRWISPVSRALFGVGGESGGVWVLGILCGFPVAASAGVTLWREGRIAARELQRLLLFSNNPSLSFLFGGVGVALFQDPKIGLLLCLTTLLSSLLLGVGARFLGGSAVESPSGGFQKEKEEPSVPLLFCRAVTSSAGALLSVIGFVVFFYTLTGVLSHAAGFSAATASPSPASSLFLGFFEMTGGIARASLGSPPHSYGIAAFLAGFSGLSVHCQIASIISPTGIPLLPCFLSKLLQGILSALLMGVALFFFG